MYDRRREWPGNMVRTQTEVDKNGHGLARSISAQNADIHWNSYFMRLFWKQDSSSRYPNVQFPNPIMMDNLSKEHFKRIA